MLRNLIIIFAAASLILCLLSPVLYFLGQMDLDHYKTMLLAGTAVWFVCAAFLAADKKNRATP
jgi:hypothetical protein